MTIRLLHGACELVLPALDASSIDACVTDPPYGIRFMGKAWDGADIEKRYREANTKASGRIRTGMAAAAGKYDRRNSANLAFQLWCEEWAAHLFRVLKPGAHMVCFGSPRTYHRLTCGLEDAGFEIRDGMQWLFGSGFPKSHNLEGEHEGWGTALKPANEPIVLARKPLEGTVAENMAKYGTGALNIEGCRVGTGSTKRTKQGGANQFPHEDDSWQPKTVEVGSDLGRWPANVLHDGSDEVLAAFPEAPGQIADASSSSSRKTQNVYGKMKRGNEASAQRRYTDDGCTNFAALPGARRGDEGSAARFFYVAKASREDRNDGCDHLPMRQSGMVSNTSGQHVTRRDGGAPGPAANNHPTVKPTELMRYLCRLITPPGGTVLDPFMGSGSTGRGAFLEGFNFIGIERDAQWLPIAEARIRAISPLFAEVSA